MRPARRLVSIALLAGSAGCAMTAPGAYGNFAGGPSSHDAKMAADAARQLATLYPPAATRLHVRQPTPDAFGSILVEALRASGFAVLESQPGDLARADPPAGAAPPGPGTQAPASLDLRYVVDRYGADQYRITVLVGQQSLTRAYGVQDGALRPASHWARRQ